jgi:hypothetical protein
MSDQTGEGARPSSPHKFEITLTIRTEKEIEHTDAVEFLEYFTKYLREKLPPKNLPPK